MLAARGEVSALHAYQPYADILRVLPCVRAVLMTPSPTPAQPRGYAPLKTPQDVAAAQQLLDILGADDELALPGKRAEP